MLSINKHHILALKNPTRTTASLSTAVFKASTASRTATGGPDFFVTQATISSAFLPPVYSDGEPCLQDLVSLKKIQDLH